MADFTPGPWQLFGNGHCVGGPENDKAGIAMCSMRLRSDEQNAANALLIAAAPELLAACEMAYRSARVTHGAYSEVCVILENAIRKAKGEYTREHRG